MKTIAIIENNKVINRIVIEDVSLAPALLREGQAFIEETAETKTAFIGSEVRDGKFVPYKQHAAWLWNEAVWAWEPPVPAPSLQENEIPVWDDEASAWKIVNLAEAPTEG